MLKVFIGYDPRQPIAFQVLCHSIWKRASKPVEIIRLQLNQLPIKRVGLTEFTYSRYLVPYLCDYRERAIFMDADMLCLADIYELEERALQNYCGVSVVFNKRRFEWPSLMVFDNQSCKNLRLENIENGTPQNFEWVTKVGQLPSEWNHIVGYDPPRKDAKIVHFTAGIPCWPETKDCEYAEEWRKEAAEQFSSVSWEALMGKSVHRPVVAAMQAIAA